MTFSALLTLLSSALGANGSPRNQNLQLGAVPVDPAADEPSAKKSGDSITFGFTGPEIFPIDFGIAFLRAADLNGDGLQDLVVANNARSKITFLLNRTDQKGEPDAPVLDGRDINELPPDARFRIDSIASEKRIAALVVTDLNNDQKPDLAYYGEPKELVVQYNEGTNGWSTPKRHAVSDGQLTPNALVGRDLNGDGRPDLLLLGDHHMHVWRQNEAGGLAEPERIPFAGENKSIQILDINGDRLNDLLLVNWDHPNPFRFRLQRTGGALSPEIHLPLPPIRSYWADDLNGDGKTEMITIAMQSGRAQIWNIIEEETVSEDHAPPSGQLQVLPLRVTSQSKRGQVWADLNADGRTDLLVAEPDSGQLTLHLQDADGQLPESKTFPSLAGVTDLAIRHDPGQGPAEIFLLSGEERQVGRTTLQPDGRIPFPAPLPVPGKPLALAVGRLGPDSASTVAVITEDANRRKLWLQGPDQKVTTRELSESFRSNPTRVTFHDVDQDGHSDLVVLIPYEKIKILRRQPGGDPEFEELDIAPPGGTLERPWLSLADIDDDGASELLLGQKNFVRAVVLVREDESAEGKRSAWNFRVKDQINGVNSQSRVIGATAVARPDAKIPWLCLLDAERKELNLCQRDPMGVWQIERNLPLPFAEFQSLESVQFHKDPYPAVALAGLNALGWVRFSHRAWNLAELDSYETPVRDARLLDVVSGDLNQDHRQDLVFLETARNYLDIVLFDEQGKLKSANRWPVFEQRTFRGRRSTDQVEPREALITDLTGDGKNDLAVIVHDRVLVYPQD